MMYWKYQSLYLKEGTLVDATIISTPPSLKNKDKKRDPDMRSTKKEANITLA